MKKIFSIFLALAILATMSAFAMTASAEQTAALNAKYELPVDDIDAWVGENMEPYKWNQPLAEGVDTIVGEVTSEGMALSFPEGSDMTYPNARVENAGGLIQTTENDYINIKASLGNAGDTDIRWGANIAFVGGRIDLQPAIAEQAGVELFGGKQLPGGDYDVTFKISDALKAWDETEGTDYYEAMYGAGGNSYVTGIWFYLFSENCVTGKPLVVKSVTIGSMEGEGNTASETSSADTSSAASTESTTSVASSVESMISSVTSKISSMASNISDSDSDSNWIVPVIVAAAALAIAAAVVVTVIVIKKKKNDNNNNSDDNNDSKDNNDNA